MRIVTLTYLLLIHLLLLTFWLKPSVVNHLREAVGWSADRQEKELSSYYESLRAMHNRADKNVSPGAVLLIGDSMFQSLAANEVHPRAVNYGIGGDTSKGVLGRIPLYGSMNAAYAVVVSVGHNDLIWRDDDEIIANIRSVLEYSRQRAVTLVTEIHPIDEEKVNDPRKTNERIREINRHIQQLAEAQGVVFVPSPRQLKTDAGELAALYHLGDGIHFSREGNALWIESLQAALKAL